MPRLLLPFSSAPGEPEYERMVFASRATSWIEPFSQLESIRASALRNNASRQIHAAVLYQSGWFLYWLEGPSKPVRELVDRIDADTRHHSRQAVHFSRGRRFLFSPWSMGLLSSTETHTVFGDRVAHMRDLLRQGFQFAPTSVIRRLSAPFGITFEQNPSGVEAFHRVGVCSAAGQESFGLVRWLAAQHGHPVGSRRMAGGQEIDSGSEYVEFYLNRDPVRIVALARSGLLQGLNRAFLCDWPQLMLLFCESDRHNEALMARVIDACDGLPIVPELFCVAPKSHVHVAMSKRAAAANIPYRTLGLMDPHDSDAVWFVLSEELKRIGRPEATIWPLTDQRMVA